MKNAFGRPVLTIAMVLVFLSAFLPACTTKEELDPAPSPPSSPIEVEVSFQAVVRAVKTGNWTVAAYFYIDPKKHDGFGTREGGGRHPIYVMVSDKSVEWGRTPPWFKEGRVEPPLVPADPSQVPPKE